MTSSMCGSFQLLKILINRTSILLLYHPGAFWLDHAGLNGLISIYLTVRFLWFSRKSIFRQTLLLKKGPITVNFYRLNQKLEVRKFLWNIKQKSDGSIFEILRAISKEPNFHTNFFAHFLRWQSDSYEVPITLLVRKDSLTSPSYEKWYFHHFKNEL